MVSWAQFAPAPGQPGTTAIHADSSAFVAWATGCTVNPGPMNIANPSAGLAGSGWPASNVIGFPEGTMGVTCLGAMYGTPFELDEIPDNPLLNKNNITHVRIIDVIGTIDPEYCTYDSEGHIVNDPWPTAFASGGMDLDAVGVIHDIAHFPTPPDEPPFIANPVPDVVFDEFPQTIEINLDGVVSDPDDPDEDIIYSIRSNSNEDELTATLNDKMLNLTRLSREEGTATLVIRAISNGQRVDFTINVTMHFIFDDIEENTVVDVKLYPNPAYDMVRVETPTVTSKLSIKVYDVLGLCVMTSTAAEINVGQLKEGVYFLNVSLNDSSITKRLMIKH